MIVEDRQIWLLAIGLGWPVAGGSLEETTNTNFILFFVPKTKKSIFEN
jgi:hypothetical protein